jgi:hypothetical protein
VRKSCESTSSYLREKALAKILEERVQSPKRMRKESMERRMKETRGGRKEWFRIEKFGIWRRRRKK